MNTLVDNITTFHGGCPQDCPDTCAMTYTVKDGKLIDVQGKPEHPMTRGGLCVRHRCIGKPPKRSAGVCPAREPTRSRIFRRGGTV